MTRKIRSVEIENFKCIKGPLQMEIAPLTFLYGANSSGKSSIVEAIKLASDMCLGKDTSHTHQVHMHDAEVAMKVGFSAYPVWLDAGIEPLAVPAFGEFCDKFQSLRDLLCGIDEDGTVGGFHVGVSFECKGGEVIGLTISEGGRFLIGRRSKDNKGRFDIDTRHPLFEAVEKRLKQDRGHTFEDACRAVFGPTECESRASGVTTIHYPDPVNGPLVQQQLWDDIDLPFKSGHPTEQRTTVEAVIQLLMFHFTQEMGRVGGRLPVIGPLRTIPTEEALLFSFDPAEEDWFGIWNGSAWSDGSPAWDHLGRDPKLIEEVNEWLQRRLDLGVTAKSAAAVVQGVSHALPERIKSRFPKAHRVVYLEGSYSGLPVAVSGVGAGVAQVLPLVVVGFKSQQAFVQQPELHLHPKLQTELGDYFISRLRLGGVHWMIETHSELLALRTLRRIRETSAAHIKHREWSLSRSDVAFYFFGQQKGVTEVIRLGVDDEGEFEQRWPRGFFTEREAELFDGPF